MVDRESADTFVKVLGIVYIVFGALWALGGFFLMVGGGFLLALIPGIGGDVAGPIVMVLGVLGLLVGGAMVAVGAGLLQHRAWARIGGIVLGVLALLNFPLGTAIGVGAIWLLGFERNAIDLFTGAPPGAGMTPPGT